MSSVQAYISGFLVREYPEWYQILEYDERICPLKNGEACQSIWIERPNGSYTETFDQLTNEEYKQQIVAYAILGMINIHGSLYLAVVRDSEPVASVTLDEATTVDYDKSIIFRVKSTALLPLALPDELHERTDDESPSPNTSTHSGYMRKNSSTKRNPSASPTKGDKGTGGPTYSDPNLNLIQDINHMLSQYHYYSRSTDLTHSLQRLWQKGLLPLQPRRLRENLSSSTESMSEEQPEGINYRRPKTLFDMADPYFNWSRGTIRHLPSHWITVLIQGYVGYSVQNWNQKRVELLLIARRATHRYGPRLNARGVDEHGNVGNFVESELRLRVDDGPWKSFVQVRGSVPIFWGQKNVLSTAYFTRMMYESEQAFLLHYSLLQSMYGDSGDIYFMSLLDDKTGESTLTQGMEHIDGAFPDMRLHMLRFNYNEKVKRNAVVPDLLAYVNLQLMGTIQRIGYFDGDLIGKVEPEQVAKQSVDGVQKGVIRTNCLDCLDRTNAVQMMISWVWLAGMLDPDGMSHMLDPDYTEADFAGTLCQFREMWCDHGDAISFLHAGTPSIYSQHIREGKQSYSAIFHYTKNMVVRACSTVFSDDMRQTCMDIILNAYENKVETVSNASPFMTAANFTPDPLITNLGDINIWCGTWNMKGSPLSNQDDMYSWLGTGFDRNAEVYVFFLQEFVELSIRNVLSTEDEQNKEALFIAKVIRILTVLHEGKNVTFHHVQSVPLVSLYIAVFVSERLTSAISDVLTSTVKTGFKGNLGTKGAVAVKFNLGNSQLSFINVHLNFGKKVTSMRMNEIEYIMNNLFREHGPYNLYSQDLFVIAGDFNFQITLYDGPKENAVLDELYKGHMKQLLVFDEFLKSVKKGPPRLSNLQEAPIKFEPTYKFKVGTNLYDPKRPPAWCDRVLFGGCSLVRKIDRIKCLCYERHDDMLSSDHKAVSAVLRLSAESGVSDAAGAETPQLIDL
ncbi:inositol 5-phosphatase [Babesia gibsoni]|uniref:phosphoinositide 5-phosphatase n=1 Tax=Babesia gibsoni TaxID=33632 RepID=A0AAD8LLQ6_BABGI|nr:inositol 5-phosphatase [Babesia gibsoni]